MSKGKSTDLPKQDSKSAQEKAEREAREAKELAARLVAEQAQARIDEIGRKAYEQEQKALNHRDVEAPAAPTSKLNLILPGVALLAGGLWYWTTRGT